MTAAQAVIAFVLAQRLLEIVWAQRNTRRLRAQGAIEYGAGHYPLFVLLHALWLAAIAFAALPDGPVNAGWLALYGVLQIARAWVMASLGPYWTTRIINLPGAALVARGPYRFVRHPNYWIVCAEIAVLPLVFGQWAVAAGFTIANAVLLRVRIAQEDAALAPRRQLIA